MPEAASANSTTDAQPIPYLFEGDNLIRCITRVGLPWFVVPDICRVVRQKQPTQAVEKLDNDEKHVWPIHTHGGKQDVWCVTEGGLYTLMLRSPGATTPGTVAHRFRRWVVSELLPTIRKTGSYQVPGRSPADMSGEPRESDADKLRKVAEVRRLCGSRAGISMWIRLGLDPVPEMLEALRQYEFRFRDLDDSPVPSSATVN